MKHYDVVIIGGGTAGIFAAYELNHLHPELKIAMIERGNPIRKRVCPIIAGKTKLRRLRLLLYHERLWRRRRLFRWKI